MGYYLAYKNRPFFPVACSDPALANKKRYHNLVRLVASNSKMGVAFVQVFATYGWSRFAMLNDEQVVCDVGSRAIEQAFRDTNVTMTEWIRTPYDVKEDKLEEYLLRMRDRTRGKITHV